MTEAEFAAALFNPDLPAPDEVSSAARFDIYRNSAIAGLVRNLEAGFPVICKLVGQAFFAAMAREFLRARPPRGRVMMLYGGEFPGFLGSFAPVADYPYLADTARLEQALRESYHAADARPLTAQECARLGPQNRVRLAPSLRLVRSDWPVLGIWRFNHSGGPQPVGGAEEVVVVRREFDPVPHLLPQGGAGFVCSLKQGASVAEAAQPLAAGFDWRSVLALLGDNAAIVGVDPGDLTP